MNYTPAPLDLPALTLAAPELHEERSKKLERLGEFLDANSLDSILLRRNENLAWISAGAIDRRVLLPAETGVPALLLRRDGKRFLLASNNEAPRLTKEDFAALDYEAVVSPWHQADASDTVTKLAGTTRVASDTPHPGATLVSLAALRAPLLPQEIIRYRWVAEHTAAAVSAVVLSLEPGVAEQEMNARAAYELWRRGIEPTVLLMAVDDRIRKYKHAIGHTGRLQRFGMVNLCARKWGLAVSLTRFVHFGGLPADLEERFSAAALVNARLLEATRSGATSAELFRVAANAYRDVGFPGEEEHHHQGGATGYGEREWVATPNGTESVKQPQAFAWNPSIQGGKVEDTVLLCDGKIEVLSGTPDLPEVSTSIGSQAYTSAGVLVR